MTPLLLAAIMIWRCDLPISVDHWAYLADEGYDVVALEAKYRP